MSQSEKRITDEFGLDETGMDEKHEHYFRRTVEHIHRVQKNALTLVNNFEFRKAVDFNDEDCRELMHRVMAHDRSKFSPEQFDGYVELTEYFRQRKTLGHPGYEYPEGARELADMAWEDHLKVENHHPERVKHDSLQKWDVYQAIECACDLQAMAQEYNEGSGRGFYEKVWKPKQTKLNSFYDDFNWLVVTTTMERAFDCFEGRTDV